MEEHISNIGSKFIVQNKSLVCIDDDKLRHSSKLFRDVGLQMTGFRGSRVGPVMNCAGCSLTGIMISTYFIRHKDSACSIVKAIFKLMGYSTEDNSLQKNLHISVQLDCGYNISTVQKFLYKLGCYVLGTQSETINNWPFISDSKKIRKDGDLKKFVDPAGVRVSFSASCKLDDII